MFFLRVAILFFLSFSNIPAAWPEDKSQTHEPFRTTDLPDLRCHTTACQQLVTLPESLSLLQPTKALGEQQQKMPITFSLPSRYSSLTQDTRNFALMSVGMMLAIYALPEETSNWHRDEMTPEKLPGNWRRNIKDNPTWDKDPWQLNYINHPYVGSMYYQAARRQQLTRLESFSYSFWMSALLWEFGIEATAEVPSRQDLIVTPLIGSIIGEAFFIWEQRLLEQDGVLLGSPALGSTALLLLNPASKLANYINHAVDGQTLIKDIRTSWVVNSVQYPAGERSISSQPTPWVGLELEVIY